MVSIDTVYQRVLALANKEQRGYITPQEFNLFANQAQSEIFEQYFYDVDKARRVQGNDTVYADIDDMLEEKLQIFENTENPVSWSEPPHPILSGISGKMIPDHVYRIHLIYKSGYCCEILNTKDFEAAIYSGPLLKPSQKRPIANIRNNVMSVYTTNYAFPSSVTYFKKPSKPQWGYMVINEKALYDDIATKTTNFELHSSEESELVYKILKFAGVSMRREDIMKAGAGMEIAQIQQEKQ